jgi:hypothetical protein
MSEHSDSRADATRADTRAVRAALDKLDSSDDGHWTHEGLPRMDVLAGFGLRIERRALTEAVPGFTRAVAAERAAAEADELAGADESNEPGESSGDSPGEPAKAKVAKPGHHGRDPARHVAAATMESDSRAYVEATGRNAAAQAERRQAALAHLSTGSHLGQAFTLDDLRDTTSPLQQRIAAQNRAARREHG